jgi:hypothetical protein
MIDRHLSLGRPSPRRFAALVLALLGAILMTASPAHAATVPFTATCSGTATATPGIFFPGVGPSQTFTWTLETECEVVSSDGVEIFALSAGGTATGFCGWSTITGGSGTLSSSAGQTISLSNIGGESAGSVKVVSGSHDAGGQGVFVAVVHAEGGASCATGGGATDFTVTVVAVFV